ncbi:MlaC/ttg2D family ABC transporter substrate-binding protein [Pseudomarimonas arenosa]|uniref:ABC transporter substrate-binding protein n=1 Tax=Pseudomarimonas arenosa TaxID=2774145 RepID=A0AAW3ZIB3_9GAMM|nr:ABC transporter substrate-binding protein [Pseudomarimonas arenosa]MBD8525736.1 ABC transporter substrate-binding protein [Pseudomarimonas arenosa]
MLRALLSSFLILIGLGLGLAPVAVQAEDSPGDMVEVRSVAVLKELSSRRDEFRAEPEKLHRYVRAQLDSLFEREYSARLVLGRHSRGVAADKINAFAVALSDNLMRKYGNALLDVDPGVSIKVKSETPLRDGKMMRVATDIMRRAGEPVPVDYMFLRTEQGWRAFDVIVEGVSYVQTYRNQFDELLRNESIDAVTAKLSSGAIDAGS